ncbi:MAG: DUF5711 family protein [Butyrivibrio sp.]|jgi:hypothetical protein|nr:DUF5711 family protein [Butyrivibrio sp.]
MAEVRDFSSYAKNKFHNKKGSETQKEEPSYKEKIRSHRLIVFYRALLSAALVCAVLVVIYIQWRDKTYSEAKVLKTVKETGLENASVVPLGNNILQYSKDGMSCMSSGGAVKWNQTFEMQSPMVHTCEDAVAVGDYNGHLIYVADSQGPLGEIDTNLPIRNFCVASQGVVAAVLDDTNVTWINLYDTSGNTLANIKTTMKDSGYPIKVSLSPNGQLLCVSFLYAKDGTMKDSIAFYNFGSVGQNETDNYASGYDYDGVVAPVVQFMDGRTSYAVSDDRIMFYSGDQVPESQAENLFQDAQVKSVFGNDKYVGIVFANNTADGTYRLQVYNTSGKLVLTKYFNLEYTDILFSGNQFVIYNESQWQLCAMDGTDKYQGNFGDSLKSIIPTSSRNRFTLVTQSAIEEVELR